MILSIVAIKAKRYIRFFFIIITLNKVFRIFYMIFKFNDIIILLNKKHTQINQSFNINVIFMKFMKFFEL